VAGTGLGFEVLIEDSGDSAEVQIPVTLTLTQGSKTIVKHAKLAFINAKEQKPITFRSIQLDPSWFGPSVTVKVNVSAVPNEHNTSNNTAQYPVIFTLPQ
jgi:hypothetical protein